jgi:hypothetical protein
MCIHELGLIHILLTFKAASESLLAAALGYKLAFSFLSVYIDFTAYFRFYT